MRVPALRRKNPYTEEPIAHRPTQSNSPYERTLQQMITSQRVNEISPTVLKYCSLCTHKIELNFNGHRSEPDHYPIAIDICKGCSKDICEYCRRICEKCEKSCCYVCNTTIYNDTGSLEVCPDCAN
ncbi:unnamed protein product [Blepharisma stoltei]|uniref:Uncharacterized protein n=1 Tax=Blepharisma stoltei TaxID=1481888 RepID=A0AAU9J305_9CILI|nr:unnamed protein product [Blepharisma stoltei]